MLDITMFSSRNAYNAAYTTLRHTFQLPPNSMLSNKIDSS
jgi:hypothetical protein